MKIFYIVLTFLLLVNGAMAQLVKPCSSCLQQGITFTTQAQIDNFQTNYPNCTQILGGVIIGWSNITNLNGLSVLTSIGGYLEIISNPALNSLTGLNGLISIGGDLHISSNPLLVNLNGLNNVTSGLEYLVIQNNSNLTSLTGLEGLTSIEEWVTIWNNPALTSLTALSNLTSIGDNLAIEGNATLISLTGLDNIDAGSINDLYIRNNNSLCSCAVQSICDRLAIPGWIQIESNATGCNSKAEVDSACQYLTAGNIIFNDAITIYPNPTTTAITLETLRQGHFSILNLNNQEVLTRQITEPKTLIDIGTLPSGIYFVELKGERTLQVGKFVKQ